MTALRPQVGLFVVCALATLPALTGRVSAQPVSELPRAEYYVARELLRAGRTLEAADGFQAALARARRLGEGRWVDSIPPLVMLGECYYQQGNLAQALEQYDAALLLALANPTWIDQVDIQPEQLAELETTTKGIGWFATSRPTRAVVVRAGLQLVVDPTQAQVTQQGGVVAPVSLVTQLDVTEVLRSMAVALMRRWEVLGPLAKHSPLAAPLDALLARQPRQPVPWLTASWRVLQGVASLGAAGRIDVRQLLQQGMLIGNQADYYLSPFALLVLGKLEARDRNYAAAVTNFQDAAILAAQFDQHTLVTEATEWVAACAVASRRGELLEPLGRLATWANKKSGSVQVAALIGGGELAIYMGDMATADKLLRQAAVVLRGREIALPRAQAQLSYTAGLLAFGQNRAALGSSNLEAALKFMRGTPATGAVVESIFQAQLTLDLLAGNSLTAAQAEQVLSEAVAEPTREDWELHPLKTLAALSTPREPAYVRLLELAVTRNAAVDELVRCLDSIQRQRLYEALPLGGRWFSWRMALAGRPDQLSQENRQAVEAALQNQPSLLSTGGRIETLVAQLRGGPLPLDERKLSAEAKKAYAELEAAAVCFESQLAFVSLQRRPMERIAPPPASLPAIQKTLGPGDLLLGLVQGGQQIYGVAITGDQAQAWQVPDAGKLAADLAALLKEIGLAREQPSQPAEALTPTAAWRITAEKIAGHLFPAEVHKLLAASQRVILAPHDRLWYVPFELLPHDASSGNPPWIVHRKVTYAPTLGSLNVAFASPPAFANTVGIVGGLFAADPPGNQAAASAVAQAVPNSQLVWLNQKSTVPAAGWLKLATDQLWVATGVDSRDSSWDAAVLPLGKPDQARLGSWLETPRVAPASVLLPALETGLSRGQVGRGNEIFLPVCGLMFGGVKTACISRWPVGGTSSKIWLTRQLEELASERPSEALRRSVLALWPEQFLVAEEPSLLPTAKETPLMISGSHPLLWSGYMVIGDYPPH